MTFKELLEKAIKGGWQLNHKKSITNMLEYPETLNVHAIVLDPDFWRAIDKEESNGEVCSECGDIRFLYCKCARNDYPRTIVSVWQYRMHTMIDALITGETLEEYLETL